MEKRLIDADALWKEFCRSEAIEDRYGSGVLEIVGNIIDTALTVDAVPVVRCKDCKWYVRSMIKQDGTLDERYKPDWCDLYSRVREEMYFCAEGERKDDDKSCDTCKHYDKGWDDAICDGCTKAHSNWERKDDED